MKSIKRDLRIDFFRGLSLLIIVADHIDLFTQQYLFKFSLKWLQPHFSDAAEIFVFLSGYVYGMVYYKYYNNNSFGKMYFRSFKRFTQLYLMNILAFIAVIAVYGFFKNFAGYTDAPIGRTSHFFNDPLSSMMYLTTMIYAPSFINILPLFMFLFLFMPFFLGLMKKNRILVLVISFLIYLSVQFNTNFNLPTYPFDFTQVYPWSKGWSFNPLVWQFVFTIGMYLSISLKESKFSIPKKKVLFYFSLIVLIFATIPRFTFILQKLGIIDFNWIGQVPFLEKQSLGFGRLIHFFSLVYIIVYIFPIEHSFFKSKIAKPFISCGQNSLEVFTFGTILTYLSYYFIKNIGINSLTYYIVTITSWALMIMLAYILKWKKKNKL